MTRGCRDADGRDDARTSAARGGSGVGGSSTASARTVPGRGLAWPNDERAERPNAGAFDDAATQLATSMSPEGPTPNDGEGGRILGARSGQVASEPFGIPKTLLPWPCVRAAGV